MGEKEKVEINGREYEVAGHAEDGLPIIKAHTETIHEGFDEEGNPKISVRVNVPSTKIGMKPGEVK